MTTGHLRKTSERYRALCKLWQLFSSAPSRARELKSDKQNKKAATASNPAGLNPSRVHALSSEREPCSLDSFYGKKVGKILSGCRVRTCAVRFTGAPGRKDRTTVATMTHLLSSKGIFSRRNTVSQSYAAVRERVTQNAKTKFFFSLPTSSVSRLVVIPAPKPKRGEHEVHVSALAQGDIVAAPYELADQSGVEHYLLGEVEKSTRLRRPSR